MDQYSLDEKPDQIRLTLAWEHALQRLAREGTATGHIDRFLRPLTLDISPDGNVRLTSSSRFVLEWAQSKFGERLTGLLSDELGGEVTLEFVTQAQERKPSTDIDRMVARPAQLQVQIAKQDRFIPNPKWTFKNFIVGQSNRLAHAGAKAVAAKPGDRYNPFFIYGGSGMGKTHLLHAIAHELLFRDPEFPVTYITAQQFAENFVSALQNSRVEQFRRIQRGVGVWLVDDIQFIAGKDKTQEEFFHTFNYLESLGKQIVLIADKPPRKLNVFDERLRSRFEAGLVADIQPPDTETRCAILLSKAEADGLELDTEIAMYLAEHVPGNIRALEGALTRLSAECSLQGNVVDLEIATRLIEEHFRMGASAKPSFSQILTAVSREMNVPIEEIKGTRRHAPIALARHVAIFVTRELAGDSWKQIGTLFGDRDHTSMMHGHARIAELYKHDRDVRAAVKHIIKTLNQD